MILIFNLCKLTKFKSFVEISSDCCGVVHELCMISEGSFRLQNLSRQRENLKFANEISCLDLCEFDFCDLLHLESLVCDVGKKMFKSFRRLRMIASLIADVF